MLEVRVRNTVDRALAICNLQLGQEEVQQVLLIHVVRQMQKQYLAEPNRMAWFAFENLKKVFD